MKPPGEKKLSMMLKASMVAALTGVLSLITFPLPMSPVPITGQTLGVCLAGLLLGPWWGAAGMGIYLVAGFAGLPVFSGGASGPAAILGPTGGYLLAFVPAAFVTGLISRLSGKRLSSLLVASLIGAVGLVHLAGSAYLAWQTGIGFQNALLAGSVPFLAGDLAKALLASLVAHRYHRAIH
jgi:biotin transport system substrate-specific component